MKCTNCERTMPGEATFCTHCGTKMKQNKRLQPSWLIAGATVTGSSHKRSEKPNQDSYYFQCSDGKVETAILAVADGAGSAPRSAEGSQIAVRAAVNTIARELRKRPSRRFRHSWLTSKNWPRTSRRNMARRPTATIRVLRKAMTEAYKAIATHAAAENQATNDYAATLLLAVATPQWIVAAQIGDGAIVAINSVTKQAFTLCESHSGEYANETVFITSKASSQGRNAYTGQIRTEQYDSVGITTDGLEHLALKMPAREAHPGFWTPMIGWLQESGPDQTERNLTNLLESQRVQERTSDDLTILLAAIRPQTPQKRNAN